MQDLFRQAIITDEHLAALAVWLVASPFVTVIGWRLVGPVAAWLTVAAVVVVPVALLIRWSGRRRQLVIRSLPETVEATSRSLRSGASFAYAIWETAHQAPPAVAEELASVLAAMEMGTSSERALHDWAVRMPYVEVEMVAATFVLAHQFQTGATQALDGVGQSLRDRSALESEVQALTAQASASLRAMVFLPLGFLFLDAVTGHSTLDFLIGEPLGRVCLIVGVALNLFGWWWMVAITRSRLSR